MKLNVRLQALARELTVWARLDHPNVAAFLGFHIDVFEDDAWLISLWAPFGDVIVYLSQNEVDANGRLELVSCRGSIRVLARH